VARIEQTMQHQNATRERLHRQVHDLNTRLESQRARRDSTQSNLDEWRSQLPGLESALSEAETAARQATDKHLPEKEEALRRAQAAVGEAQRELSQHEQARQVDETSLGHTKRQLEQLDVRRRRLEQEQAQLPRPDAAGLAKKQVEVEDLAETLATAQAGLKKAEADLPELDAARTARMRELEAARKALHQTEAELAALKNCWRASRPTKSSEPGCICAVSTAPSGYGKSCASRPAGKPRSRRCCASACRPCRPMPLLPGSRMDRQPV
jgi:chromosome segregation protein